MSLIGNMGVGGIQVKTGTFTMPASTGNDSVTGVGFQPKALFMWGCAVTDQNVAVHSSHWIGFVDNESTFNQRAVSCTCENGEFDTRRRRNSSNCLEVINTDTTSIAIASLSSYDSDGFTLNYSTTSSGLIVNYIAFGGDNLQSFVNNVNSNDLSESGIPFQPELVFFASHSLQLTESTNSVQTFGVFNDKLDQWHVAANGGPDDEAGSADRDSILFSNSFSCQIINSDLTYLLSISSITSDGFTWTTIPTDPSDDFHEYLALNLNGRRTFIGTFTKETTGVADIEQSLPNLGFRPQLILLGSGCEIDEVATTANNERATIGAYDSESQNCTTRTSVVDVSNSDQRTNNSAVIGIASADASYDALGVFNDPLTDSAPVITWTTNDTNAYIIGILAIETSNRILVM